MKYIPFLLFIIACNNNSDDKSGSKDSTASKETVSSSDKGSSTGSCSAYTWFKEGSVAKYAMTDGKGNAINTTTNTVNKVYTEGNATIAEFTSSFSDNKKSVTAKYKCEGDKIMMDMQSLMKDNFASGAQDGFEMEFGEAWLSFPSGMKVGDNLGGGEINIKAKQNGKEMFTMKSNLVSNKVDAAEKITTPAGSWEGYKITEVREIKMKMGDKEMPGRQIKSVYYFVPKYAIVKYETYDGDGKIILRSELISATE